MKYYSDKMARNVKTDDPKTVIVITDYWNPKIFRKYEKEMLKHAMKDGIWYIFLLLTDYGVTQIPFLPIYRDDLDKNDIGEIEGDLTPDELLHRFPRMTIEYDVQDENGNCIDHFYVDDLGWNKRSNCKDIFGNIKEKNLCQLLEDVGWIYDIVDDEIVQDNLKKDANQFCLGIFGKTIRWNSCSVLADNRNEYRFENLPKAINRFILACIKDSKQDS